MKYKFFELQYLNPVQIKPECIRFNKNIYEMRSSDDTSCQNSYCTKNEEILNGKLHFLCSV